MVMSVRIVPLRLSLFSIGTMSFTEARSMSPLIEARMPGSEMGVLMNAETSSGLPAISTWKRLMSMVVASRTPVGFFTLMFTLMLFTAFGNDGYLNMAFMIARFTPNAGI